MLSKLKSVLSIVLKLMMNKNVERTLIGLVTIFAIILTFSQVGMVSDSIRPYLSDIEVFEGNYISQIDNIIKEGTITLELVDMSKEKDIKILVNGKEVSGFDKKFVDVKVRNNSIVEVDGTRIKSPVRVRVTGKTENIINEEINKEVKIESNIKVITRVKLK